MDRLVKFYLYGDYVFAGSVTDAMNFLDQCVSVDCEGYGRDATFTKKVDSKSPDFELISLDQFKYEEEDQFEAMKRKLAAAEKNYSDSNSKRWSVEAENKKLKDQLEALQNACPAKPAEDVEL